MKKLIITFVLSSIIICSFYSCESTFGKKEADCVVVGNITVQEDFENDIKFLGEIKNQGDAKALYVKITFTLKNAAGDVIGTDYTYVNSTDLDPGQTSSFECWTETPYNQVESWEYDITWNEESSTLSFMK